MLPSVSVKYVKYVKNMSKMCQKCVSCVNCVKCVKCAKCVICHLQLEQNEHFKSYIACDVLFEENFNICRQVVR